MREYAAKAHERELHRELTKAQDNFADILITCHALDWTLEDELAEFERVVRPGGHIIHCPGTAECAAEEDTHWTLVSAKWGYAHARYQEADGWKRKYWKERQ